MDAVFITDDNYSMPTGVAISSLIVNNRDEELCVHIICDSVSVKNKEKFLKMQDEGVSIDIIEPDMNIVSKITESGSCTIRDWPLCDMLKFWFPVIFDKLDRILYLDGDIIVNKSIADMYHTEFGDNYVAAINDMKGGIGDGGRSEYSRRINLPCDDYFNAGVMLFNLAKMREDGMTDKLLQYRMKHEDRFMDQDTMNSVLYDKRVRLPYKYNFLTVISEDMYMGEACKLVGKEYASFGEMYEEQAVLHMAGKYKPWLYMVPYISEIYKRYYKQSPYFEGKELELVSPLPMMNKEYRELDRLYAQLFNRTDFIRKPRRFIKKLLGK